MTTITLSIPPEAKRYIKAKAALQDITMKEFVLQCVGWDAKKEESKKHEYTSDDFNEETRAAMEEDVSTMKQYNSVEEMIAEMKTW